MPSPLIQTETLSTAVVATGDRAATGAVSAVLIIGVIAVLLAFVSVVVVAVIRNRSKQDDSEPHFRLDPPQEGN